MRHCEVQYAEAVPGVCILYVEVQRLLSYHSQALREDLIQDFLVFAAHEKK